RGHLLHLPPVVPVHPAGRAAGGIDARRPALHRSVDRDHRGGRRRDPESRRVLRLARPLAGRLLRTLRRVLAARRPRRARRAVALPDRDDPGDLRLRRRGAGLSPGYWTVTVILSDITGLSCGMWFLSPRSS